MKAILVIDINDDYLEDYENFYVDYDLRAECKDDNVNESIRYVEDCPLKPMPTRKLAIFDPNDCDIEEEIKIIHEIEGYNRCIDEILGEKE